MAVSPRMVVAVAALAVFGSLAAACGGDEDRVALAITSTEWQADGSLAITTECAELTEPVTVAVGEDAIPLVTMWGAPKVGTCETREVIAVPEGTTKVLDAATSQIVDLPPQP